MVQSLCTDFSPSLLSAAPPEDSNEPSTPIDYHPFPTPQQLAQEDVSVKLRELGFGYRAEYVQRTAAMLCEEHENPEAFLTSLRKLPTEEVREELLKLCGVGPKVADCVLLMSMDKVCATARVRDTNRLNSVLDEGRSCRHSCTPDCAQILWTSWHTSGEGRQGSNDPKDL